MATPVVTPATPATNFHPNLIALVALYASVRNLIVTVDLDAYWLERQVNAQKRSFVATASCGWAFHPNWEAMLAGSLGTTPYFERRAELIARLTYRFGLPGGFR